MPNPVPIAALAEAARNTNARRLTLVLVVLDLFALLLSVLSGSLATVVLFVACTLVQGLAYGLARAGRTTPAALTAMISLYAEVVVGVIIDGTLGQWPTVVPVAILIAAATLSSRWLFVALGLGLATEALLLTISPWSLADQSAIAIGVSLTVIIFVVSRINVGGTEQAFALAEAQAAQVEDSERRYRLIADNTDDLIALFDREGQPLYVSPSHARLLGIDAATGASAQLGAMLDDDSNQAMAEAFASALASGRAHALVEVDLGERELVFDVLLKRVEAEEGLMIVTTGRDVTEMKALERRLLRAERLESLGRLAGGVAHDFNNLLTVIGTSAELAEATLEPSHDAAEDLRAIREASETASRLTKQLLTFSRRQVVVRHDLDLGAALTGLRPLLERLVGEQVELELDLAEALPLVRMPPAHLEQLAMNLAVNARDAMRETRGRRLCLSLVEREIAAGEVEELAPGPYVRLSVADEGPGIPAHVLPRLFDPFFTTKGSAGTGLGLATCHSIVTQLDGAITVETEAGRGTTFHVYLPCPTHDHAAASRRRPSSDAIHTVLLLDDDPAIRDSATRVLRRSGHQVHATASLAEARALLADSALEFDALLTDVVLSHDRGTELLDEARRLRPGIDIVIMSGYTPEPRAAEVATELGARFIAKPFGSDELLAALHGDGHP